MFKYDPHKKTEKEIERTFISGKKYLENILDDLKPKNKNLSNQSILLAGQRGMGKSHFLRMAALRIDTDKILNNYYLPVIFPEELFKVGSLYHLLKDGIERIFSLIEKDIISQNGKIERLKKEFIESCDIRFIGSKKEQKNQRTEVENNFFSLLKKISTEINKKFIFLLENLQILFGEKLSSDELKRLRGFLQENPNTLLIIGSAVSIFERVEKYGEPFYNFFKFRRLTGLNKDDVRWFLETEGKLRGNPEICNRISKFHGEIEVFRILTGGNPRLILFLYDLLEENEELVIDDILKKITELTPYFKSETEKLTAPKQMVLDALCENAPAQTPSEIAEYLNEPTGIVIENLRRLLHEGWIKIIETERGESIKKSETFYSVSDYFYRIWYQVRQSVSLDENVKWMAELASLLFNKTELEKKFKSSPEQMRAVYRRALELHKSKFFMEFKKQLPMEPGSAVHEAYERLGLPDEWPDGKMPLDFAYLWVGLTHKLKGEIDKAVENYKNHIEETENPENSPVFIFETIKTYINEISNKEESIKNLTNPEKFFKNPIISIQELLCLGQFNGVEAIVLSIFTKMEETKTVNLFQKEKKELYFYLMAETILRLCNKSGEPHPEITARYFLRTAFLLKDKKPVEKKILRFLVNYIKSSEKLEINKEGLMNIFSEWQKMNIVLPESVIALIDALKNPKSRSAQVWSSDPLFREVLKILERK